MTAQVQTFPERLKHIKGVLSDMSRHSPATSAAFGDLHKAALQSRALDEKTKEVIALSIAVASRCDGCIAFHAHDALRAGATKEEIYDALGVAVMMGGGPSLVYATHVMEAVDQFDQVTGPELGSVDPRKTIHSAYLESSHHFD